MTVKEFILREKDNFTMDKVFVISKDITKFIINGALYRKIEEPNKVILYENEIIKYYFDIETGENIPGEVISGFYRDIDFKDEEIHVVSREKFKELVRKSIKYYMKNNKRDNELYKSLLEESKKFGGKISYNGEVPMMFIGISCTDEDYYYVFVYRGENDEVNLYYYSAVGRVTFIDPKECNNIDDFMNFINNNKGEIIKKINNNYSDVMISGINFGIDETHYRKYDRNALLHLISTYKKLFKYGKMADVLMDILDNQVSDFDRCNVLQVLYEVYNDYVLYYRDLDEKYKRYYVEYFWEKCNTKLQTKLITIQNEHLKSYYIGFCETFKRVLLEEANIKKI